MRLRSRVVVDELFDDIFSATAADTLRNFRRDIPDVRDKYHSAVLVWARGLHDPPRMRFLGNVVRAEEWRLPMHHALEKWARLQMAPVVTTAWESRDETLADPWQHKYGGGFKVEAGRFALSGFTEKLEDYFLVATLYQMGCITDREIGAIVKATNNDYIERAHSGVLD